jgi:hypothetical protein
VIIILIKTIPFLLQAFLCWHAPRLSLKNFTSAAVREAIGSYFMHKYSEGYPGARYESIFWILFICGCNQQNVKTCQLSHSHTHTHTHTHWHIHVLSLFKVTMPEMNGSMKMNDCVKREHFKSFVWIQKSGESMFKHSLDLQRISLSILHSWIPMIESWV